MNVFIHREKSTIMHGSKQLYSAWLLLSVSIMAAPAAHAYSGFLLYSFTGKADGANPVGGVVQDAAGNYYGETFQGGSSTCPNPPYTQQGCGTVYRLAPDGIFTVLASFNKANGAHGNITPVLIGTTLYGATAQGGGSNNGVIFSVHTDGTGYRVVHQFTGADGSEPRALVAGPGNTLYGIAVAGGAYNYGTLYSIAADGTFADLHDFNQPSGISPVSLTRYGLTVIGSTYYGGGTSTGCIYGCGTVFTYTPASKTFSTVFSFPLSGSEGAFPYVGSVGPGPTIYGANAYYIFSLSLAQGYTNLLTLSYYGHGVNSGPLYAPGGILYGTLGSGNAVSIDGLVYSLLDGRYTIQGDFSGDQPPRSGAGPEAQPILNHDGNLVGTNSLSGKCNTCGAIWLSIPGPA